MPDRTSHLAGFDDDLKVQKIFDEEMDNPCLDCPEDAKNEPREDFRTCKARKIYLSSRKR